MGKDRIASKKAEAFFTNFKRKYPDETRTYWNLASIYDRSNGLGKAKAELRGLLKLEPGNKNARDYLHDLEQE